VVHLTNWIPKDFSMHENLLSCPVDANVPIRIVKVRGSFRGPDTPIEPFEIFKILETYKNRESLWEEYSVHLGSNV